MNRIEQSKLLLGKAMQDQAILKALLVLYEQDYPRSHDLNVLISLLARINIFLPSELQAMADLSPMATIYRYEDLPSDAQVPRHEWPGWIEILRKIVESELASN